MLRKGNAKGPEPPVTRGNEKWYTFHIHHGGTVVKDGRRIKYQGGTISTFDYVDVSCMSHDLFNGLAAELGYRGPKKFYRINSLGEFCPIVHVLDILLSFDFKQFDVHLYVHPNEAVTNQRQVGGESSSAGVPTMVIGGKKYVTMGNLQAAMVGKTIKKKKGGKKGK